MRLPNFSFITVLFFFTTMSIVIIAVLKILACVKIKYKMEPRLDNFLSRQDQLNHISVT